MSKSTIRITVDVNDADYLHEHFAIDSVYVERVGKLLSKLIGRNELDSFFNRGGQLTKGEKEELEDIFDCEFSELFASSEWGPAHTLDSVDVVQGEFTKLC